MSTAAARSPGTAPGRSLATRSSGCRIRSTSSRSSAGSSRCSSTSAPTSASRPAGSRSRDAAACGFRLTAAGRTASWARSASASPRACPCTGSRSTATATWPGSTGSCRAASPTRASRRCRPSSAGRSASMRSCPWWNVTCPACSPPPSTPEQWGPQRRLDRVSVAPEGRRLLRLEVRNSATPIEKKPSWIKTTARMGPEYRELQSLVKREGMHTVCQEAGCPNIFECWENREATFLIGGDQCTRRCDFCQIDTGKPQPLDRDEPRRVAESVQKMELKYATITGVARDDLPDGGAWLYAETVRAIHELNPDTGVENLIPDFNGTPELLREVFESRPEVLAHNVETVPRIFKRIRPAFRYDRSLDVITQARDFGLVTKSNLILGMGETREEISQALRDLHEAGCELITITQYLRPSPRHHPVERWVKPEEFVELKDEADEIGFAGALSGPLVRSSYRAGRLYGQAMDARAAA